MNCLLVVVLEASLRSTQLKTVVATRRSDPSESIILRARAGRWDLRAMSARKHVIHRGHAVNVFPIPDDDVEIRYLARHLKNLGIRAKPVVAGR